ncbi:MAG: nucleotide exchange factor GrpE [Actinomycetes bacterium]
MSDTHDQSLPEDQDQPAQFAPEGEAGGDGLEAPLIVVPDDASSLTEGTAELAKLRSQLSERTADLQRLQAEYVNYKRRVDRDRDVARARGVESVVNDLLPVLDAIEAAKQHEAFDGGLRLVTEALEKVTAKYGLVAFGEVGEEFDPNRHEALMHMPLEGNHTTTVISAVMQKGVMLGDRVVRPARVGVDDPN